MCHICSKSASQSCDLLDGFIKTCINQCHQASLEGFYDLTTWKKNNIENHRSITYYCNTLHCYGVVIKFKHWYLCLASTNLFSHLLFFNNAHWVIILSWKGLWWVIADRSIFEEYDTWWQWFTIGAALANSVKSDLRFTWRVYFDKVTPTSQKPCQHNNKCDWSKTNSYNFPQ